MGNAPIAMPPALFVAWACRRCGHTGGHAKCNIPVHGWTEEMMRTLFDTLRRKLVQIHIRESLRRGAPCVASPSDFDIMRGVPAEKTIVGVL